ncbi:MAG: efflux RND transporter periplasmic adaptor subunit [bacterium]
MKKWLIISGIVIVVAVIVIANLNIKSSNATKVNAEVAQTRDIIETVSASGRIQPQTKVDITSEINGEIVKLYVKEGQYVNKGDQLLILDTIQLRSDLDQAKYSVNEITARLEGAKSSLEQTEEEFHRQEKLYENKLTSETEFKNSKYAYLNAKSAYEATKAQAQQSEARYDKALDYLSKAKVVAPMPGIITFLDCEEGEIAAAQTVYSQGKTLMTVSNLDVFEVEVEVDETEVTKVELGQEAKIEIDAFPDTTFMGEVVEVGNTAIYTSSSDQSTNFKVKVIFIDKNEKIRPGMSATVDITSNEIKDALAIPYSAVVMRSLDLDSLMQARSKTDDTVKSEQPESDGLQAAVNDNKDSLKTKSEDEVERKDVKGVYVIREGKAIFELIETGIADQKYIEVLTGLKKDDSVVSGPYKVLRSIKDDEEVEIIKKKDESE